MYISIIYTVQEILRTWTFYFITSRDYIIGRDLKDMFVLCLYYMLYTANSKMVVLCKP